MKYQVRLSARAERDVDQVLRWFHGQRATVAGGRWYANLMAKIETLEKQPERCRLADESTDLEIELRELLFGRRRGTYRILRNSGACRPHFANSPYGARRFDAG
jgi:plasmid stabilization system protein ParE